MNRWSKVWEWIQLLGSLAAVALFFALLKYDLLKWVLLPLLVLWTLFAFRVLPAIIDSEKERGRFGSWWKWFTLVWGAHSLVAGLIQFLEGNCR